MVKRKKFISEFKREAVGLMESSGKLAADLAREAGLGVRPESGFYKRGS